MKKGEITTYIVRISFWYLIFSFIAADFNPTVWSGWTRFWFVLLVILTIDE